MKNASEARQRTEWERKIRRWQKSKGITVRGQEKVLKNTSTRLHSGGRVESWLFEAVNWKNRQGKERNYVKANE